MITTDLTPLVECVCGRMLPTFTVHVDDDSPRAVVVHMTCACGECVSLGSMLYPVTVDGEKEARKQSN